MQTVQQRNAQLDMKKVKETLQNEKNESYCCAILQALRWRVTRTTSGVVRRGFVIQFVSNDFLNYSFMNMLLEKKGPKVVFIKGRSKNLS